MRLSTGFIIMVASLICPLESSAQNEKTVAIIGTGDMGNSLGPKLASIGYRVIYGRRDPSRESVQALTRRTDPSATATTQKEAAQSVSIVLLAVGWRPWSRSRRALETWTGR